MAKGLLLLLSIALFSTSVRGCMPGYEAERAKLRQYLGIEWVPNGMDTADAKKTKFIRHSSDLNCNFRHPEDCKWQNAKGIDTLDFHLFKKEDHTPFPVVQVRPGPSKIEVGDHLLFTGDRKKKSQNAILYSWPIKCQNSTGTLHFTFWTYNGARVEVLLFEDVKTGNKTEIRPLPESLHVDCGTVTMDTECKVEIPPRDQPFRLAIRAYDIQHPEGSFVMLDNVYYEATLCKVAIDLGDDFKTEELLTGAEGLNVNTASDLACLNFDRSCRWRNGGHSGSVAWKRGVTAPPELALFNETGTYTTPKGPYAFLYVEQDATGGIRKLVSDPVDCQASAGSTLTLRIWATKGVKVEVCTMDLDMNELDCQNVNTHRTPAPSTHHFTRTRSFMYGIKTTMTSEDNDQFVMIDDIDYEATMCTEAIGSLDFGKGFYTTPLLGVILNRAAHSAGDLACDFSRRGVDCFWANLDENSPHPKWEVGLGAIDQRKFTYLTSRNDFAVARFPKSKGSRAPAILISETIRCMHDGASLSLSFWKTGQASLEVCVIHSFSEQDVGDISGEKVVVDIPNYKEPVRLALKAELKDDLEEAEGLIAVDDIELQARLCTTVAYSANSHLSKHSRANKVTPFEDEPRGPASIGASTDGVKASPYSTPDANVCRLLSCNFEKDNMCLYESKRVAASVSMFSAFNKTAHSMLFERGRVSVLESSTFHLNAPARLHFDYAIAKGNAQVHVCQDSIRQELDSCYAVKTSVEPVDGFVHDFIEVLPSDTKIYVIAKLGEGSRKASVFLDNLELTDTENRRIC